MSALQRSGRLAWDSSGEAGCSLYSFTSISVSASINTASTNLLLATSLENLVSMGVSSFAVVI